MCQTKYFAVLFFICLAICASGETPVELANPLVGTAALDDPKFIGNAPPPGEEIYTGFVWPGPDLYPASPGDAASVAYGSLPYALFEEIRLKFIAALKTRATRTVPRTA